jgi:hypothetical protein
MFAMSKKIPLAPVTAILFLTAMLVQAAVAQEPGVGNQKNHIRRVLLVSIDGMHAVD